MSKTETLNDIADSIEAAAQAAGIDEAIAVENGVETFEQVFKSDPLAARYKAFGVAARELFDSSDACIEIVRMGQMACTLMDEEKKILPTAFERARVIEKLKMAMTLCGSPIVMAPQEIVSVFWLYKLDLSVPGDKPGDPRSFAKCYGPIKTEWFGGNISTSALRVLDNHIHNTSRKDEVDSWEFDTGWEPWCRDMVARLRRGEIGVRQLDALATHRKKSIAEANRTAARAGKSPEQVAQMDQNEANAAMEAKHTRLGKMLREAQKFALDELDIARDDLTRLLVNKGIVEPAARLNNKEFARQMMPGDAKALVQCLAELLPTDPNRYMLILKSLARNAGETVKQMKSASKPADQRDVAKVA